MGRRALRRATRALALILASTVGALLLSDRLFFGSAAWLLHSTTGYRLITVDAALHWWPLRLTVAELRVEPGAPDSAPLFAAEGLELRPTADALDLAQPMARRGQLRARSITLFLDERGSGPPPDAGALLRSLQWLPARADVASVHLVSRDDDVWVFPLFNVSARHDNSGRIAAISEARIGTRSFTLEVGLDPIAGTQGLDVLAGMTGRDNESQLRLQGQALARGQDLHYDLSLSGEYARIDDFLSAFDSDAKGFAGALQLSGRLRGSIDSYTLAFDQLDITHPPAYSIRASGELTGGGSTTPTIALEATGDVSDTSLLDPIPTRWADTLRSGELRLAIAGPLSAPLLTRVGVQVEGQHGLQLRIDSLADPVPLGDLATLQPQGRLELQLSAPDQRPLAALVPTPLPEFGPWSLRGSVLLEQDRPGAAGRTDSPPPAAAPGTARLQLQNLRGTLSVGDHSDLTLTGQIGELELGDGNSGVTAVRDIDLGISLTSDAPDRLLASLSGTTGATYPWLGAVTLQATVGGAVEDAPSLRGLALNIGVQSLHIAEGTGTSAAADWLPVGAQGTAFLRRAADRWQLRDIALRGQLPNGAGAELSGSGELAAGTGRSADLYLVISAAPDRPLPMPGPLTPQLRGADLQLRLRPDYATLLGTLRTPHEPLQISLAADLADDGLRRLGVDIYTRELYLPDLNAPTGGEALQPTETPQSAGNDWTAALPSYPIAATLRVDSISGGNSQFRSLLVEASGDNGVYLLRHLDADYAGGLLELRGALDTTAESPQLSLAGRGTRFPLGALGEDLGLPTPVRGKLSVRGGITTAGRDVDTLLAGLRGRLALAIAAMELEGPAYDLLMSDLLAWIAAGAGTKTTQIDCSMAQFDFENGVASSDSLYLETSRMLATGRASIDLRGQTIDLRLEPRSRQRSLQFPSDVTLRGPLTDPKVSISPLQTTFDTSARALFLLPDLALRLFGLGADSGEPTPCLATLQQP